MRLFAVPLLALMLLQPAVCWGQDYDKGIEAYKRGDYAAALNEFRVLAEKGDADAQFNLGFMYEKGKGVVRDYSEAVKWYRKAAKQGQSGAQTNLGVMYEKGKGVPQDLTEAAKWNRMAAVGRSVEEKKKQEEKKRQRKREEKASNARAEDSRSFEECRATLQKANKAGIIYDMELKSDGFSIVVDGTVWRNIDFNTKLNIAKTINCWLSAGGERKRVIQIFPDNKTNHIIGKYGLYGLEVMQGANG